MVKPELSQSVKGPSTQETDPWVTGNSDTNPDMSSICSLMPFQDTPTLFSSPAHEDDVDRDIAQLTSG